jgi:hypothetical protein
MDADDYREKIKGLDVFVDWVDNYCIENHIPNVEYNATDAFILQMDYTSLLELSSEECYVNAICLMNYASNIQKTADKIKSHLSWCDAAINYLFSKKWEKYSVAFQPKEVIQQSIIDSDPYAQEVEKCRIRLRSVYNISIEQCKDIKKRVELLQDLGKKRSFS